MGKEQQQFNYTTVITCLLYFWRKDSRNINTAAEIILDVPSTDKIIIIIKRHFIRRSNMARVTTKAPKKVSHYHVIKKSYLSLSMRLDLFVKLKYESSTITVALLSISNRCVIFWNMQMWQHCRMFCQCVKLCNGRGNRTQMTRGSCHY